MSAFQPLAAEFAITVADGAVWLAIGQGLLFGGVCLLFGIWVARRVGLLRPMRRPARPSASVSRRAHGPRRVVGRDLVRRAELVHPGRRSASRSPSSWRSSAGRRIRSSDGIERARTAPPVEVWRRTSRWSSPHSPVAYSSSPWPSSMDRPWRRARAMASSPSRTGTRPSTRSSVATSRRPAPRRTRSLPGSPSSPAAPAQTWYHWGELWLASAAITIFGAAPLAARYLRGAARRAAGGGRPDRHVVRRMAPTDSRWAYLLGFMACLFLAPVALIPARSSVLGRSAWSSGSPCMGWAPLRACSPCTASSCSAARPRRGRSPASLAAPSPSSSRPTSRSPILAFVGVATRVRRSGSSVARRDASTADRGAHLGPDPRSRRAVAVIATVVWGDADGPQPGWRLAIIAPRPRRPWSSPFNASWARVRRASRSSAPASSWRSRSPGTCAAGRCAFPGRPLRRDHRAAGRRCDRLGRPAPRLHDVLPVLRRDRRLRDAGRGGRCRDGVGAPAGAQHHERLAIAVVVLCLIQLEIRRRQRARPASGVRTEGQRLRSRSALLGGDQRQLPPDAKLAYSCGPFDEVAFGNATAPQHRRPHEPAGRADVLRGRVPEHAFRRQAFRQGHEPILRRLLRNRCCTPMRRPARRRLPFPHSSRSTASTTSTLTRNTRTRWWMTPLRSRRAVPAKS